MPKRKLVNKKTKKEDSLIDLLDSVPCTADS